MQHKRSDVTISNKWRLDHNNWGWGKTEDPYESQLNGSRYNAKMGARLRTEMDL